MKRSQEVKNNITFAIEEIKKYNNIELLSNQLLDVHIKISHGTGHFILRINYSKLSIIYQDETIYYMDSYFSDTNFVKKNISSILQNNNIYSIKLNGDIIHIVYIKLHGELGEYYSFKKNNIFYLISYKKDINKIIIQQENLHSKKIKQKSIHCTNPDNFISDALNTLFPVANILDLIKT